MLTPGGPPDIVLELTLRGIVQPVFNQAILAEYRQVLGRPRFSLLPAVVMVLLDTIEGIGLETQEGIWPELIPDKDNEKFLVSAAAGGAVLITGNLRDFPMPARRHVRVLSPREFIDRYAGQILPFPGPSKPAPK